MYAGVSSYAEILARCQLYFPLPSCFMKALQLFIIFLECFTNLKLSGRVFSVDDSALGVLSARIFSALKWDGLHSVEFSRDEKACFFLLYGSKPE